MSLRLALDHVVLVVKDLQAAGQVFEAAGFHVTPEARHSPAMGTANRCIMLDGNYIELMGIVAETSANVTWRSLLALGAGIRGLALRSSDIEVSAGDLAAKGIAAEPARRFSRMTPDGELRFSVIRIDSSVTPGLQCLLCQHHTPELLWRPEAMRHPNGASSLVCVALPEMSGLDRLAAHDAFGVAIAPGSGRLVFLGETAVRHDLREVCGVEIEVLRR
ncbi:MAG: VOC family protein [Shinella sp.]|nr:VOC family protein [Shinella sp.]